MDEYAHVSKILCINGWIDDDCKNELMDTWMNMHMYLAFYACMDGWIHG